MPKKTKQHLDTVIYVVATSAVEVAWSILYIIFLQDIFMQLSALAVVDLSKTLIQSIGILVSLIIASSFVYIGKMDELTIRLLSKESDLDNKQVAIRDSIECVTALLHECSTRLSKLKNNKPDKSNFKTKKELEKTLSEIENENKENISFLERTVKLGIAENLNKIERTKGLITGFLAFDIVFFLISIILAIIAFVYESGGILGISLIFIVFGMILMFSVWHGFYEMSRIMRDFFRLALSIKPTLRIIAKCTQEYKRELDKVFKTITTLSKT